MKLVHLNLLTPQCSLIIWMFTWPPSWWCGPPHLRQHPSQPHISIPSVSQLHSLYSERSVLLLFTQQVGNQYQKRGIWIADLAVCSKLGQFVEAGNKDAEGTPIEEDTQQKERLKRKNGWQWGQIVSQRPCSQKLRGQISWAEEGRVRLQGQGKASRNSQVTPLLPGLRWQSKGIG